MAVPAHKQIVLVVDEAHQPEQEVLKEIRMLAEWKRTGEILPRDSRGQPQLNEMLDHPESCNCCRRKVRYHIRGPERTGNNPNTSATD